ncbi:G-protein coupled receptor family C group 6 member A-like isoform X2 [Ambystoma mexicanum]|uniref:G-protein coupled receptor family C group 6 member A-like isoform X2 n=1 Tax=Ambystoma mexicanum TaxID=8296 RepID=UPI0037E84FD7
MPRLSGYSVGSVYAVCSRTQRSTSKCDPRNMCPVWMCVLCFSLHASRVASCSGPEDSVARLPGDIIIGGLFPIHQVSKVGGRKQPDDITCSKFFTRGFIRSLAMIYTIESINNSSFLPGIKLGYEIFDTCSDSIKGLQGTMRFVAAYNTSESTVEVKCNYTDYVPNVKAVVGAGYSEVSMTVARVLGLYLMPQISYASTAEVLSEKQRYPSFLRTVPSDVHQIQCISQLIAHFQWNWVGIISSDDDYGRSAAESFQSTFEQLSICIAFRKVLPSDLNYANMTTRIEETIQALKDKPFANVVVLYAKGSLLKLIFSELMKQNISRTWIASGVWSTDRDVAALPNIETLGTIIGVAYKNAEIDGFNDYLQNLHPGSAGVNTFIEEYKRVRLNCTDENISSNCSGTPGGVNTSLANDEYLVKNIELGGTYGAYLAVKAVAEALKNLLCSNGSCDRNLNFPPWQLLGELYKINITQKNNKPFYFNPVGDGINGYDILTWNMVNGSMQFTIVGTYELEGSKLDFNRSMISWYPVAKQIPISKCSALCSPGFYKKNLNNSCCFDCLLCPENSYINATGYCTSCQEDEWSNNGSLKCEKKLVDFLRWNDAFAIVLLSFAALGFLTVFTIGVIFVKHINTPAVKAAGGVYSCIMNISLLISLTSPLVFIGEPTDVTCQVRQPLYGLSFTLCVSCVLIKSLRILLAFELGKKVKPPPKMTYQPAMVMIIVTCIQVLICTLWLTLKPPRMRKESNMQKRILQECSESSDVAFGFMLGYIGFLAFVCFAIAFRGRHLPGKYNEARLITFSMLIYLFVWIVFIPVHISVQDIYHPAVQVVAMLASCYGIISCHLLPTVYVILFKKNSNNQTKYFESVRRFYKGKITVSSVPEKLCDQNSPISNYPGWKIMCTHHSEACSLRKRRKSF